MALSGRSLDDQPLAAYARRGSEKPVDDAAAEVETRSAASAAPAVRPAVQAARPLAPAGPAVPAEPAADTIDFDAPPVPPILRRAGAVARQNPRLVAGAGFVAMIVIGLLLLGGGTSAPGAASASASPSAPSIVPVAADPGSATLVLTGALKGTYTFAGTATQPVAGSAVAGTWTDTFQNVLTLDGSVDRGTRQTDAGLVLTWALMVDGKLVTFTSKAGECTIGMASTPKVVSGSFACRKIRSDDGKLTVEATGTYRT
jgi:hypothetical protein